MRSVASTLRHACASVASGSRARTIHYARPCFAQVSPPLPFSWSHLKSDDQSRNANEPQASQATSSLLQDHRASVQQKRERKLREYEAKIKVKAMQEGLSPEEFKRKSLEFAAVKPTKPIGSQTSSQQPEATSSNTLSDVEKRDQALAEEIGRAHV